MAGPRPFLQIIKDRKGGLAAVLLDEVGRKVCLIACEIGVIGIAVEIQAIGDSKRGTAIDVVSQLIIGSITAKAEPDNCGVNSCGFDTIPIDGSIMLGDVDDLVRRIEID